ncbi:MAG: PCP reductase family protein [Nitrospirales bacterium]
MQCGCDYPLRIVEVEELPSDSVLAKFHCARCGFSLGAEGNAKELDPVVSRVLWTDEALYQLSRLPPYLLPLVREEVEEFASTRGQRVVTVARVGSARNKGMVEWTSDAERRINNVPSGIRAMARIELERTALDRGMPAVTVALMEEVKARYFGMAAGRA